MIREILERIKRGPRPEPSKAFFVRVVPMGDKEEGKRRGRSMGVYVGDWNRNLFALVYYCPTKSRWKIRPAAGLPPVDHFPDEATRSPFGVKLDLPRTRSHAIAIAAAHLRGLL